VREAPVITTEVMVHPFVFCLELNVCSFPMQEKDFD
jgi:hypothetical protein